MRVVSIFSSNSWEESEQSQNVKLFLQLQHESHNHPALVPHDDFLHPCNHFYLARSFSLHPSSLHLPLPLLTVAVTRLRSDLLGKPRPACPCERRSEEPAGGRRAKRNGNKRKENLSWASAADRVKGEKQCSPHLTVAWCSLSLESSINCRL